MIASAIILKTGKFSDVTAPKKTKNDINDNNDKLIVARSDFFFISLSVAACSIKLQNN